MTVQTSTVIQAGGQSRRMGRDKALVALAGRPLIAHVVERVAGLSDEMLVTCNRFEAYAFLGLPLFADAVPGGGALPGLQTALAAAQGERVLVVACDMPFLARPLLRYLLDPGHSADVVIPEWDGQLQPLVAVYNRAACLPAVEAALAADHRRATAFHGAAAVHVVDAATVARFDPAGDSFCNINTPADLARAARRIDGRVP